MLSVRKRSRRSETGSVSAPLLKRDYTATQAGRLSDAATRRRGPPVGGNLNFPALLERP